MAETPQNDVSLSGEVLFYRKPELLSKEAHEKLGINTPDSRFGFAANAHICPLTVPEFGLAALSYPVIFVGKDYQPVCVMGLQEGQNLFTSPEKGFEMDVYIPAYIRRYPFVLAGADADPSGQERMLVAIDRAYEFISDKPEFPFFKDGEPTEYTNNCIKFCNDFQNQIILTRNFIALMTEMDMWETRTASYTPQQPDGSPAGEPQLIADFFAISDAKLNALPADKLAELRDNGALQMIYAHLNSLSGWERLIVRALVRQQQATPVAANA